LVAAMRALDLSAHGNSVIANPARDIS